MLAFLRTFAAFGALALQLSRTSADELERRALDAAAYVQSTQEFLASSASWSLEPPRPAKASHKATAR